MKENDSNRCRPMYLDVLVMIGCEVYCGLTNSDKTLNPEFQAKWAEVHFCLPDFMPSVLYSNDFKVECMSDFYYGNLGSEKMKRL